VLSNARLSTWFERTQTPGRGLLGGKNGEPGDVTVTNKENSWKALKCADVPVEAGTMITIATGGGGGFGPAEERTTEAIEEDILQGYTV
jgi:N-methylhydantoinase B